MCSKLICSGCGEYLEPERIYKHRYCLACHAAWARANRPEVGRLSKIEQKKIKTRDETKRLIRHKRIIKTPCVICQNEKIEIHHRNYDDPKDIVFLCRKHHLMIKEYYWFEEIINKLPPAECIDGFSTGNIVVQTTKSKIAL